MRIITTAPDRKTLVRALAGHLGERADYLGPPSFAFKVGDITVDREGGVLLPDGMDPQDIQRFLEDKGWLEPEQVEEPVEEPSTEPAPQLDRMTISVPAEGLTVRTMQNLLLMLFSKQYLLGKAVKGDTIRIDDAVAERLKQPLPESPVDFRALVDDFKTHGQITGVNLTDDAVSLAFPLREDEGFTAACSLLTACIMAAAKTAIRVHPERQEPENEKYHMRSWLIRLGLGGKDAKAVRDVLLKHLKGHSAFRTDEEAQKHRDKYAQIRRACRSEHAREAQHEEA